MYLLKIETEEQAFRHAVARIEWPAISVTDDGRTRRLLFLDYFYHTAPLWLRMPILSASLRIDVSAEGRPVTWHGLTISVDNADLLRRAAAAFMRLDGMDEAVVSAPGDLGDFQAGYAVPRDSWWSLSSDPLTTSAGGEFFNAVRIFDRLPALLASAIALGHSLTYQATLKPGRPHAELLKRTRKAVAFLQRQRTVPERTLKSQAALSSRLDEATMIVEEAVSIAPAGEHWLEHWLSENVSPDEVAGRQRTQDAVRLDDDSADAFAHHIHPDLLVGPRYDETDAGLIGKYWRPAEAESLSRCDCLWRPHAKANEPPPVAPLPVFFPGAGPQPSGPAAAPAGNSSAPFFFVSYARKNVDTIRPILDRVAADGVRLWIDSEIKVGEEWDTRLETMITTSAGLLVFLSPEYVASKHCRRELKFADALDKDIFASSLAAFPMQSGFGYIFASLQYAAGRQDEIAEKLAARLREKLDSFRMN